LKKIETTYNGELIPIIFGHMGDGNLHFNFAKKELSSINDLISIKQQVKALVVEKAMQYNGTFSAEHGIGLVHKQELENFYHENQYKMLKLIQDVLNGKSILNPNKII
jgi:FAD/FMN-containing dehydrogenase